MSARDAASKKRAALAAERARPVELSSIGACVSRRTSKATAAALEALRASNDDQEVPATIDVMALIGDARIRFWMCPNREHRFVTWADDVATCDECGVSSAAPVSAVEPVKDGEQ